MDSTGDAANLAARLRMLALLLCALLAQPSGLPAAAASPADGRKPARPAGREASVSAPDTS
jgi:hypothetical protein